MKHRQKTNEVVVSKRDGDSWIDRCPQAVGSHNVTVLRNLAVDPHIEVRVLLAGNPAAVRDPQTAQLLCTDKSVQVRWGVAGNPDTPVGVVSAMSGDPDDGVRALVAGNTTCPADLLMHMGADRSVQVRRMVAGNPATPGSCLTALSTDTDPTVRARVAGNPSMPHPVAFRTVPKMGGMWDVGVLARLCMDSSVRVRGAVASNPRVLSTVLVALAGDPSATVRARVAGNPSVPSWVVRNIVHRRGVSMQEMCAAAGNPAAPQSILAELSRHGDDMVRARVAGNPSLGDAMARILSHDVSGDVRDALVCAHPAFADA